MYIGSINLSSERFLVFLTTNAKFWIGRYYFIFFFLARIKQNLH